MTAIIYFGEIFVASLLVIALLSISPHGVLSASELFIGGVVVWTLVEYLVHRFVLHDFFPMRHGMHHANPDEPVLTVFWQIWACFAVVYFVADGAFLAGALGAYAWYLLCITARTTAPINCCYHCSSIMKPIIGLRLEILASARPFGIMYSGRCRTDALIRQSETAPLCVERFSDWR